MSVCVDGSTISALLFSHLNSKGNQYGFLFGEKIENIEDKISDSQIHAYAVNSYIHVSSFIPWPNQECIYNRSGQISDGLMQQLLSNREQHLVGWYSFRHNTTLRPSLRERTLHQILATSEEFNAEPQEFLFFLCTSLSSKDMSIHTCSYGFMHAVHTDGGLFLSVPVTVINLGDTTQQEYRKRSNSTLSHSEIIQGSLQSIQKDFLKSSGEMRHKRNVNHLAASINTSLMSMHGEIAESETTLGLLEAEVADLKQQLDLLEREEMEKVFQIEAENRRKDAEEENRQQNAEEREQLEKLLIDLGNSTDDLHCGAPVIRNLPLEPSTSQSRSKDHATTNSIDRNTNCAGESSSTALLAHDNQAFKQKNIISDTDDNAHTTRAKETMKDNISDAFPFLEDEFRFNQNTAARQHITYSGASTNTGIVMMHSQNRGNRVALDGNEFSKCKEGSSMQDLQSKATHLKHSGVLLTNCSDNVTEIPADNDMRLVEGHKTTQLDQDTCVDKYIVSSSPVF